MDYKMIRSIEDALQDIEGDVILPVDEAYDEARAVWNGMINRYPAVIVRCQTISDVQLALGVARESNLVISVRGGGHNVAGFATNDDGMVIDLSPMRAVTVYAAERLAVAQAGATWADVDSATQAYGLATPGGQVSETGIAGLTLGGGIGAMRRSHGLTIDALRSVDIVTADGQLLCASEDEHADLFWAVRGGGGNFGIVVNFTYQLYPVGPEVMTATVMYPFEQAKKIISRWHAYALTEPDEVSSECLLWSIPAVPDFPEAMHNQNVIVISGTYIGDAETGEKVLQPLRELAEPLIDMSGVMPFVAVQNSFDPFFPAGVQRYYWKSLNLKTLSDLAIDAIINFAEQRPSPQTLVIIRHLGGAMGRVDAGATAFGDRSAQFNLSLDSTWVNPADDDANITWTRSTWNAMDQFSDGGVYLNFPGMHEEGVKLLHRQFGKNYERLTAIKKRYDPFNVFRLNQNIKPQ